MLLNVENQHDYLTRPIKKEGERRMSTYPTSVFSYTIQPGDSYYQLSKRFNVSAESIFNANLELNPHQLYVGQIINIPQMLQMDTANVQARKHSRVVSKEEDDLKNDMRLLWEQHVAWTRMTIISLVFHLPDVDFVITRLLQNATDMGHSLLPYYGKKFAKTYGELIKDHLIIAANLVKAALAGDQKTAGAEEKKWYANANEIVEFLTHINPYLNKEMLRNMFYEHLALTKAEAVFMITKDYHSGVEVYDKIEREALEMSDAITKGIVKQFPGLFVN